ncbi:precorrin-3B synthase [Fuscibacter oryzae]|uniref:Precorrin-3B synthase n=1 Tax=Fuscibacter oryzae TaxID=2803939 RepID=A0A8J7MR59_9RHOB|nr:precorrin-3B synthase [Fuscibacter oryzae]MBL4929730.1 precorrin-3B synthase [Fuscibacter oryzae]
MSTPVIQGWCPGALRPMASGDGLVVRIRLRGGRMTPDQVRQIAGLSATHGNGLMDLSARANLQLRGVTPDSHAPLIAALTGMGLIDRDEQVESRRNILISPFWREGDDTQRIAADLAQRLSAPDAPALPGKFGYAIDIGSSPVLREASADIRVERLADGALIVRAEGMQSGARATADTAADAMLHLARWFVAAGGVNEGRGRMAALVARGAPAPESFHEVPAPMAQPFVPMPGLCAAGALVGLAFGQTDPVTLTALAALGPLRLTPWRMLLVEGLRAMPDLTGLITVSNDPMLRVVACTGAPGCLQAHQPTRDLASRLAPHVPQGSLLHVSGCAKGCAHPGPAALTLTATPRGFHLIRRGAASATPALPDLNPVTPDHLIETS